MHAAAYSLLLKSPPGARLSDQKWDDIIGEFQRHEQLVNSLRVKVWKRSTKPEILLALKLME